MFSRVRLEKERSLGAESVESVMLCEVYEALESYRTGDYANALSEVYDIIAVCDRFIARIQAKLSEGL